MNSRFTIDGSPALETHLASICEKVRDDILALIPEQKIEAIILGGGYGRGEGGVLKNSAGDQPYNDMEFYVCLRGNEFLNTRKFRHALHHLGENLTSVAGVEVEFKIISSEKILSGPVTMFFYDLAAGHRTIFGDDTFLASARFHQAENIPAYEATRLLMNRCSGLLFAREQLRAAHFTSENADFVGRNQAKAQLGFGDVVLAALGKYHWSCRERNTRLQQLSAVENLPFLQKIFCHHTLGTEFKLHPQKKSGVRESFLPLQDELEKIGLQLWLWLENRRLQKEFQTARDYALSRAEKCPETKPSRNRLVNLKAFGFSSCFSPEFPRYPRERLLNSLPLLLWEPDLFRDIILLRKIQRELRTNTRDFSGLVHAYRAIWQQFN